MDAPPVARTGEGYQGCYCCIAVNSRGGTMSYARQLLDAYPGTLTADAGVLAATIGA